MCGGVCAAGGLISALAPKMIWFGWACLGLSLLAVPPSDEEHLGAQFGEKTHAVFT